MAVCSEIHTKHKYAVWAERRIVNVKPGGTYSNHWALKGKISVIKTSQLMQYSEIIAVCSQIHTKYTNTLRGQNVELLNVKLVVHIVTTGL